jgi:DnaD/phage-associated family protein
VSARRTAAARDAGLPFFPRNIETARDLANEYGLEWLLEAIKRAADGKAQTWGYVKGILRSWKEHGGMDDANKPRNATGSKRVTAQTYTQRNYTDAELNSQTLDLLREAMELTDQP